MVIASSRLQHDTTAVLSEIYSFLGISESSTDDPSTVRTGSSHSPSRKSNRSSTASSISRSGSIAKVGGGVSSVAYSGRRLAAVDSPANSDWSSERVAAIMEKLFPRKFYYRTLMTSTITITSQVFRQCLSRVGFLFCESLWRRGGTVPILFLHHA